MPLALSTNHLSRKTIAVLLITAVLFAQWLGMLHRIAHADRFLGASVSATVSATTGAVTSSTVKRGADGGGVDRHSCTAFDAATLADLLRLPHPCTATVQPGTAVLALWLAFTSWDAPHVPLFSSRAPPFA